MNLNVLLLNFEEMDIGPLFYAITAFLAVACLFIVFLLSRRTGKFSTRSIVYAAVTVAMCFILNFFKVKLALTGGSITFFRLLPLVVYSYMFGPINGVLAGLCYGLLDSMIDPYIVHPLQYVLDYALPFCLVGLSGLTRNCKKQPMLKGALIAMAGRVIPAFISGAIFFASYMPADYFVQNAWIYSFYYQCMTCIPDMAIVALGAFLITLYKPFMHDVNKIKMENDRLIQQEKQF